MFEDQKPKYSVKRNSFTQMGAMGAIGAVHAPLHQVRRQSFTTKAPSGL